MNYLKTKAIIRNYAYIAVGFVKTYIMTYRLNLHEWRVEHLRKNLEKKMKRLGICLIAVPREGRVTLSFASEQELTKLKEDYANSTPDKSG